MKKYFPRYPGCMVCGDPEINPRTYNLRFAWEDGVVRGRLRPDKSRAGYPDVTHGGVLSTILDEVMIWAAAAASGQFTFTGGLNVRFLKPAGTDVDILFEGRVAEVKKRFIVCRGRVVDDSGKVFATGEGNYFPMPEGREAEMFAHLVFQPEDWQPGEILKASHSNSDATGSQDRRSSSEREGKSA